MPLAREKLEAHLARINAERRPDLAVTIDMAEPARFVLSFPDREMLEGMCIDQDFTEIQFALFEHENVTTGIQSVRQDEADRRYHVDYEVVEWD